MPPEAAPPQLHRWFWSTRRYLQFFTKNYAVLSILRLFWQKFKSKAQKSFWGWGMAPITTQLHRVNKRKLESRTI